MSTLSVWRFEEPDGADRAVATLKDLSTRKLITVMDAATVIWPENAKKPTTRQLNDLAGRGALGGAFWGMLFGLLFFVPVFGMAVGAGLGASAKSLESRANQAQYDSEFRRLGAQAKSNAMGANVAFAVAGVAAAAAVLWFLLAD